MENSIQKTEEPLIVFTEAQIDLIKRTVAAGATNDELSVFLNQAKRMGLDPLSKQIYFQKFKTKEGRPERMTIIVAIDGYRLIAARTGLYAGSDDAVFEYNEKNEIIRALVTVYRIAKGIRCPFTASARWEEYCPPPPKDHMWNKMPFTMLAKVAEALALRKAFPAELSGTYTSEEMEQAGSSQAHIINPETGEILKSSAQKLVEKIKEPDETTKIIAAFSLLGISKEEIERIVECSIEKADINILRALYASKKREAFEKENVQS
jgi:phage recombination protein Bet